MKLPMPGPVATTTLALMLAGEAAGQDAAVPLGYVGTNARIGLSIDQDAELQGEGLVVLGYNGKRALLIEGWLGHGGSGGLQTDYHWLWGDRTVTKLFLAVDQNSFDDRKASVGVGFERAQFGLDVYYSHALTDERLTSSRSEQTTTTVFGDENGRPFRQDVTVHSLIERFEHPYEHGIGLRLSRFLERSLLRVHGGLDCELGEALLQGDNATQLTATLGLDKHFEGSGHSIGVEVGHFRKDGPFDSGEFGGKRTDTRALLRWRYEFGQSFRPLEIYNEREKMRTVQSPAPAPQIRRTEVQLGSEALFEFDRAEVTDAAKLALRGLVQDLKTKRVGTISIVGHTCDIGSDEYNQRLSERRAFAVREWLIEEGLPADALEASGRGEREPGSPNDSEANRALNRRIALTFMAAEETVIRSEAAPQTITERVRERVPLPEPWIERALRTPAVHKRTVDTYRIERVTQTQTLSERVFLNRAPGAADDASTTLGGVAVTIAVLANDTDPDGDSVRIASVGSPGNGRAVANADGTITYTPNAGFAGTDTFTYTIADGSGLLDTASVAVDVRNRAPVATDDTALHTNSESLTIDVLANDFDPDGDPLRVSIVREPANATVFVNPDNTVTFTSAGGFIVDSFEYAVTDPHGATDQATVTVDHTTT